MALHCSPESRFKFAFKINTGFVEDKNHACEVQSNLLRGLN